MSHYGFGGSHNPSFLQWCLCWSDRMGQRPGKPCEGLSQPVWTPLTGSPDHRIGVCESSLSETVSSLAKISVKNRKTRARRLQPLTATDFERGHRKRASGCSVVTVGFVVYGKFSSLCPLSLGKEGTRPANCLRFRGILEVLTARSNCSLIAMHNQNRIRCERIGAR